MFYADSHIDLLSVSRKAAVDAISDEHVRCVVAAYYSSNQVADLNNALKLLNSLRGLYPDKKLAFEIEDISIVSEQYARNICHFEPLVTTLTWNSENRYAGGAFSDVELTDMGKSLIAHLENCGGVLDMSHLNETSFWQASQVTKKPLFVSHSGLNVGEYHHSRNISLEMLARVVQSEGYFGFALVSDFYDCKAFSADIVVRYIDIAVQRFGIEYFGIGSDFFGTDKLPIDVKSYADFVKIIDGLKGYGYKNDDIAKIMYGNLDRYLNNNLTFYEG